MQFEVFLLSLQEASLQCYAWQRQWLQCVGKSVLFIFNLLFSLCSCSNWFGNDLQGVSKHPLSLSIITWPLFYSVSSSPLKHFSKDTAFYFQYFPHGSAVTRLAQDPLQGMKLVLNPAKPLSQPKAKPKIYCEFSLLFHCPPSLLQPLCQKSSFLSQGGMAQTKRDAALYSTTGVLGDVPFLSVGSHSLF